MPQLLSLAVVPDTIFPSQASPERLQLPLALSTIRFGWGEPGQGQEGFIPQEAACWGFVQPSLTHSFPAAQWLSASGGFGWWQVQGQCLAGLGLVERLCRETGAILQLLKRSDAHVGDSSSQLLGFPMG